MTIRSIARLVALLAVSSLASCTDGDPVAAPDPAPDETPPSPVSDLRPGTRTDSTLTLLWTAPGDDGDEGSAWRYDVRRAGLPIADSSWGAAVRLTGEPVPSLPGRTELFIVHGLGAEDVLYFALKTIDHAGNVSSISNVAEVSALDTTPPGRVGDLRAVSLGEGRVDLTWTATGDDGEAGAATGYVLRHAAFPLDETNFRNGTLVGETPVPGPAGAAERWTIRLEVGREAWLGLQVWDEAGNSGPLSNVVSLQVR